MALSDQERIELELETDLSRGYLDDEPDVDVDDEDERDVQP